MLSPHPSVVNFVCLALSAISINEREGERERKRERCNLNSKTHQSLGSFVYLGLKRRWIINLKERENKRERENERERKERIEKRVREGERKYNCHFCHLCDSQSITLYLCKLELHV